MIDTISFDEYSTSSESSIIPHSDKKDLGISILPNYNPEKDHQEIYSIIGIGDPIVDVTSYIEPSLIEKYGLKIGDSIFADEASTDKNIEVFNVLESMEAVSYVPGGSVQNSMRVLSWCLGMEPNKRDKFNVSMLGSIGDDDYKNKILNALKDNGVNSMLQVIKGDKTSRCGVGIYKKEKLFVTQIRASKRLSGEYIEENLERILAHQILIIEGYLMKNKFDVCEKLCEYFSNRKKMIILTLSASFIPKYYNENLLKIANKSDIIAGSMEEAKELAGNEGKTPDEIFANIFKKLTPKDNRLLVITDGANGAFCAKYDYHNDKMEYIVQTFANTLKDEEIQELNGAGDAFLGGFLSEFMKGYSICDCLKNGIEAASVILKNVGCTFPKNQNFLIK